MLSPARCLRFVCAILLILFWVVTSAQGQEQNPSEVEALRKELQALQSQMADVQARLDKLSPPTSGAQAAALPPSSAPSSEQQQTKEQVINELNEKIKREVSKAVATYQTSSEDSAAAPRVDNAPLDPRYPGYFRLPGTLTLLKIGGYFKTDFIRDIRPAGNPDMFIPATIPVPANGATTNANVSVRPTRINLDFLIPTQTAANVRFFVEFDMFGTNATTPRLRHAYAQVENFLIGQSFSNFQDPDAGTDQLDFQGPNAMISLRNPQFRYTVPLGKKTVFRISLEKASSDVSFTTPQFNAQPSNIAPDGALTLRREMDRGHVQFSALLRAVGAFLPNGASDSVFGWGFSLAGSLRTFGNDRLVYQGAYGHGIERYINDTSGLGIDAAPISTAEPRLEAIPVVAPYAGYQHFWTDKVRSNFVYGFVQVENTPFQPSSEYHKSDYLAGNVIWNPLGSLNVGTEFLYGWQVLKSGQSGNAPRIMFSAKYSFVKTQSKSK